MHSGAADPRGGRFSAARKGRCGAMRGSRSDADGGRSGPAGTIFGIGKLQGEHFPCESPNFPSKKGVIADVEFTSLARSLDWGNCVVFGGKLLGEPARGARAMVSSCGWFPVGCGFAGGRRSTGVAAVDCIEIEVKPNQFLVVGLVGAEDAFHAEDDMVDEQAEAAEFVHIEEDELAKVSGQFQASLAQDGRVFGSLPRSQADSTVEQKE